MRLAVTADLHWGHHPAGDAATLQLVRQVELLAPEVLLVAGDVGEGRRFAECLNLFTHLPCRRLVMPGNHDLWTREPSPASLVLYESTLPERASELGWHYLDHAPCVLGREAIVGTINWYDYSFADPGILSDYPDAGRMYRRKLFPGGLHNDGRYVNLGLTDEEFTAYVVDRVRGQLAALPADVERVVLAAHHPPLEALFYPGPVRGTIGRFWLAYTGNRAMQDLVLAEERICYVLCGHTHAAVEARVGQRVCWNVGGDYPWKRLLLIDTDSGESAAWEFGR